MTEATTQQPTTEPTADTAAPAEDTALAAAANEGATESEADKVTEGGEQAGEDEGAAQQEAATGAPEAYDTAAFTMPDGVEFDADGFAAVEPVLRDLNLTQDQAGKLMAAYGEKIVPLIAQRTAEQFDNAAAELRANLARELQADPEVGGKKLEESRAMAAKAIAHAIPQAAERSEFSTFLNESGLGNHPLLMRIVSGYGRALAEASTPAGEHGRDELTPAQKFYGKRGNT